MTAWALRVTFDGTEVAALEAHTSHGVDQFVGSATISLTLPLPAAVVNGAAVVIDALADGVELSQPLFSGIYRALDRNLSVNGNIATLKCEGHGYRATYSLEKDVVFAGGARTTPGTLLAGPTHVGDDTITWYADDIPDSMTVSVDVTPGADSTFVWVAGKVHGSNSYDTDIGDKKITSWSRIEVWQDGAILGFAHLPVSSEQWADELDYTDINNWDDFEVFIACDIVLADGDVTFKFVSGRKPGSTARDEYEVRDVTWQTAGDLPVRAIVRGLMRRCGFDGTPPMSVYQVTELGGNLIRLGGNGLVDAGQVRIDRNDTPKAFIERLGQLFGYRGFDCPDGRWRFVPIRGEPPDANIAATFVEGTSLRNASRSDDPGRLANVIRVEGASGSDQDGKAFAFASQTADVDIPTYDEIPDPPGIAFKRYADTILTSDELCDIVREIQEANNDKSAVTITWETWPRAINPGRVVEVTADTIGFDGRLFLTSIRHDLTPSGFTATLTGWAGAATPFSETEDPDEAEVDALPSDPRPAAEWTPYRLLAGVV